MTSKLIGNIKDFTRKWHYLKEEVDNKLKLKSDVGHTHSDNDVSVTTTNYGSGINQNEFNNYLSYDMIQVKNKVDSVVHTSIALDKYNCKVGDTVTVTVTVTGGDGVGLSDYKVNLYCNGTSLSNGITNSTGVYSYSYTVTSKGVLVFNVGESNVQCLAKPVWSTIYSTSNFDLQSDGEHCELSLHIPKRTYGANTTTTIETLNPDYRTYYNPKTLMILLTSYNVFALLTYNHELQIINKNSGSVNIPIYGGFQYTLH